MTARDAARRSEARLRTLADVSRAVSESRLDGEAVLDTICRQLAQGVGDACILRLVSEDGQWQRTCAAHSQAPGSEAYVALAREFIQRAERVI